MERLIPSAKDSLQPYRLSNLDLVAASFTLNASLVLFLFQVLGVLRVLWVLHVLLVVQILLKQNTVLLSTVRPCVCVTGVTFHISHIYKGINATLIIRGPIKPFIF